MNEDLCKYLVTHLGPHTAEQLFLLLQNKFAISGIVSGQDKLLEKIDNQILEILASDTDFIPETISSVLTGIPDQRMFNVFETLIQDAYDEIAKKEEEEGGGCTLCQCLNLALTQPSEVTKLLLKLARDTIKHDCGGFDEP